MGIFARKRRWNVHLCTMTAEQQPYYDAMARWLRQQGHRILAEPGAPLAERLATARACDLAILLLGPTAGQRDPQASFSATELEAYAALEGPSSKLLIFAQPEADAATSPEQREFVARLRDFAGGTFQATTTSPQQFVDQVQSALKQMQATAEQSSKLNLARAVMISSTGDLTEERERLRALLTKERHPVIDYQLAASETTTPIERVTTWAGQCRAVILVLGSRYGYVSPVDGLGVTELEFVTALGAKRPILVLLRPEALTTTDPDQQQFVARVWHLLPEDRVRLCPTLADVEREARDGLRRILHNPVPSHPAISPAQAQEWYQRHLRRWLGTLPHPRNPMGMPLTMPLLLTQAPIDVETLIKGATLGWLHFMPETLLDVISFTPEDALANTPRLIIAGPPGAGKSAILRWYALTAAPEQVPVLVTLPDYARARAAGRVASLLDYLEREERRMVLAVPKDPSRWRAALQSGQGLLLLDDWDALTTAEQTLVAQDLQACAAQVPESTRLVVAQRAVAADALPGFTPMFILPLLQGQQQEIITQWMQVAHQHDGMTQEQLRERVITILFQMRSLSSFTSWARTPRLLAALITVIDATPDATTGILGGSGAVLLRRVLRQLYTLDAHPHALWEKEQLLLAMSRITYAEPPQNIFSPMLLQTVCGEVGANVGMTLEAVLRDLNHNALLSQQGDQWSYIHPIFQALYDASVLAAQPADARNDQVARHRLYAQWDAPLLLPGELDRLGRPEEADAVIGALFHGDSAPIADSGYPDPFHYALYLAASAQGARLATHAAQGYGPETARRLMDLLHEAHDQGTMLHQIMWTLSLLGPAAATVMDEVIALLDAPHSYSWLVLRQLAEGGNARAQAATAEYYARKPRTTYGWANMDSTMDELLAALRSIVPEQRWQVAISIGKFGPRAASAVPDLMKLLAEGDDSAQSYAADTLTAIGLPALPALPQLVELALHSPDGNRSSAACYALRPLGHAAASYVPAIAAQLQSDDAKARKRAVDTAGALGEVAASVAPTLVALMLDDAAGDDLLAFPRALAKMGPAAVAEANAAIAAAIKGDDAKRRNYALQCILPLGSQAAPLIDVLRGCLRDPAFPDQGRVIYAIGYLKEAAASALPELRELLAQKYRRSAALSALQDIGVAAQPLLDDVLTLYDDPESNIGQGVWFALTAMQVEVTPRIEAALLRGMQDDNSFVRTAAYSAAAALRPVRPAIVAEMLRRFAANTDEREDNSFRLYLPKVLMALWDAGPLA